jgi:hypothetical protein
VILVELPSVAWTEPLYTRRTVDEAGRTLIAEMASREDRELALATTNNWRSCHAFPLNTFQINLRRVARSCDSDATVAQRIKRLPSIVTKLQRLPWLSLAQMQDLGGCRAVLADAVDAQAVAEYYMERSAVRHTLLNQDHYIEHPKQSGYRGIHLIYAYQSDRSEIYNGLKIEMQLRSRLQHAWATAVETVGAFTAQALKSSAGQRDWLRFFALMSSALAMREECTLVPGTPTEWKELREELGRLTTRLRVVERLSGYSTAMRVIEDMRGQVRFVTLELDTVERVLRVEDYNNQVVAAEAYNALERAAAETPGLDVVLVRVGDLDALRTAYPNYFADTTVFVDALDDMMAR